LELVCGGNNSSWWRKSTTGCIDSQRFELHHADDNLLASTTLWDLEPLASTWGVRAAGVLDLQVAESMRRRGIATHLMSEVMRQLRLQGVSLIEAQTMIHNEAALAMYRKLGFIEADRGAVFRKEYR
jgi:ribosomal protein S18 acetylase RimI-like enzyme